MKRIIDEIKVRLTSNNCWCAEVARSVITAFLAPHNLSLEELADIRCSVSEAVYNCVIHAYKEPSDKGFIYISARLYNIEDLPYCHCGAKMDGERREG